MNYKRFYIKNTMVFFTLVTYNRNPFLLDFIEQIKNSFAYTKTKYDFKIIALTIMQDHLHFILHPTIIEQYSDIIKTFKTNFSRNIDVNKIPNYCVDERKLKKGEKCIWQSRFWSHVILNEKDLYTHLDYIHYNSYKHYNIAPKDWKYSTFTNYVKDGLYENEWLNFNDKNNILNLNFE